MRYTLWRLALLALPVAVRSPVAARTTPKKGATFLGGAGGEDVGSGPGESGKSSDVAAARGGAAAPGEGQRFKQEIEQMDVDSFRRFSREGYVREYDFFDPMSLTRPVDDAVSVDPSDLADFATVVDDAWRDYADLFAPVAAEVGVLWTNTTRYAGDQHRYLVFSLKNGMTASVQLPRYYVTHVDLAATFWGGYLGDPSYAPGLAHYMEHMVLLREATAERGDGDIQSVVIKSAGSESSLDKNGVTTVSSMEFKWTTHEAVAEGLHRAFHSVLCPQFPLGSIETELRAVEMEFSELTEGGARYAVLAAVLSGRHKSRFGHVAVSTAGVRAYAARHGIERLREELAARAFQHLVGEGTLLQLRVPKRATPRETLDFLVPLLRGFAALPARGDVADIPRRAACSGISPEGILAAWRRQEADVGSYAAIPTVGRRPGRHPSPAALELVPEMRKNAHPGEAQIRWNRLGLAVVGNATHIITTVPQGFAAVFPAVFDPRVTAHGDTLAAGLRAVFEFGSWTDATLDDWRRCGFVAPSPPSASMLDRSESFRAVVFSFSFELLDSQKNAEEEAEFDRAKKEAFDKLVAGAEGGAGAGGAGLRAENSESGFAAGGDSVAAALAAAFPLEQSPTFKKAHCALGVLFRALGSLLTLPDAALIDVVRLSQRLRVSVVRTAFRELSSRETSVAVFESPRGELANARALEAGWEFSPQRFRQALQLFVRPENFLLNVPSLAAMRRFYNGEADLYLLPPSWPVQVGVDVLSANFLRGLHEQFDRGATGAGGLRGISVDAIKALQREAYTWPEGGVPGDGGAGGGGAGGGGRFPGSSLASGAAAGGGVVSVIAGGRQALPAPTAPAGADAGGGGGGGSAVWQLSELAHSKVRQSVAAELAAHDLYVCPALSQVRVFDASLPAVTVRLAPSVARGAYAAASIQLQLRSPLLEYLQEAERAINLLGRVVRLLLRRRPDQAPETRAADLDLTEKTEDTQFMAAHSFGMGATAVAAQLHAFLAVATNMRAVAGELQEAWRAYNSAVFFFPGVFKMLPLLHMAMERSAYVTAAVAGTAAELADVELHWRALTAFADLRLFAAGDLAAADAAALGAHAADLLRPGPIVKFADARAAPLYLGTPRARAVVAADNEELVHFYWDNIIERHMSAFVAVWSIRRPTHDVEAACRVNFFAELVTRKLRTAAMSIWRYRSGMTYSVIADVSSPVNSDLLLVSITGKSVNFPAQAFGNQVPEILVLLRRRLQEMTRGDWRAYALKIMHETAAPFQDPLNALQRSLGIASGSEDTRQEFACVPEVGRLLNLPGDTFKQMLLTFFDANFPGYGPRARQEFFLVHHDLPEEFRDRFPEPVSWGPAAAGHGVSSMAEPLSDWERRWLQLERQLPTLRCDREGAGHFAVWRLARHLLLSTTPMRPERLLV